MDTKIVAREDQIASTWRREYESWWAIGTGGRMVKAFDVHPLCSPQLRIARLSRSAGIVTGYA